MNEATLFLIRYGPLLVFTVVFLDQMGVPLPAIPWLLAAGALSATGKFSALLGLGITVLACLLADTFWFYLGRYRGHRVLDFLCRVALEPDSCVRRTQNAFMHPDLSQAKARNNCHASAILARGSACAIVFASYSLRILFVFSWCFALFSLWGSGGDSSKS